MTSDERREVAERLRWLASKQGTYKGVLGSDVLVPRMHTHDSPVPAHVRRSCGLTFSGQTPSGAWTLGAGHGGAGLEFREAKAVANRIAAQLAVMVR